MKKFIYMFLMIFQSLMGLGKWRCDILNGITQGWVCPIIDCDIISSRKWEQNKWNVNPLFWIYQITFPFAYPTILIQFSIIPCFFFHWHPPLNMKIFKIFKYFIFHNLTFRPFHPHMIQFHNNYKISNNMVCEH
jgi:hypothetical protein